MARTGDWTGKEPFHITQKAIPIISQEEERNKKKLHMNLVNAPEEKKMDSLEWQQQQCKKSMQNKTIQVF